MAASDTTSYRRSRAIVCSNLCSSTGPTGPQGPQGVAGSIGTTAIGSYYSMSTQSISTPPAAPTIMAYDNTNFERYVSLVSSTRITVAKTAIYEAYYSIQIDRTSGGSPITIYIWLKKNGSNVPDSNSSISINSNNDRILPIVPYIISLNAGDYVEFAIQATDINTRMLAETPAIGPGLPSIIVGIKEIG